jgi:PHD/YefM family antitoxin component YafN of YafNO toxin-antitoxin module
MKKNWKQLDVSEARKSFADLISGVGFGHERVVLCRNGKALVALIPLDDLKFLEVLEDQYELNAARESMKNSESIGIKDMKKRLNLTS